MECRQVCAIEQDEDHLRGLQGISGSPCILASQEVELDFAAMPRIIEISLLKRFSEIL